MSIFGLFEAGKKFVNTAHTRPEELTVVSFDDEVCPTALRLEVVRDGHRFLVKTNVQQMLEGVLCGYIRPKTDSEGIIDATNELGRSLGAILDKSVREEWARKLQISVADGLPTQPGFYWFFTDKTVVTWQLEQQAVVGKRWVWSYVTNDGYRRKLGQDLTPLHEMDYTHWQPIVLPLPKAPSEETKA